jgi:haloalkane dehalogenase
MLELYRSFDLNELEPYQGRLAELGVPALVLWGQRDDYLPRDYASRFASEIPGAELVLLENARHFLFEDEPERCAQEVIDFLRRAGI